LEGLLSRNWNPQEEENRALADASQRWISDGESQGHEEGEVEGESSTTASDSNTEPENLLDPETDFFLNKALPRMVQCLLYRQYPELAHAARANQILRRVIELAIKAHPFEIPGLLESMCLAFGESPQVEAYTCLMMIPPPP